MKLTFVVPVHGRHKLAGACLRQLARTRDDLRAHGLDAGVVLAGEETFFAALARDLGFGWVTAANRPLGRKWNDGFVSAVEDGATHLVPFGSDDAIDPALIVSAPLPSGRDVRCCRRSAVVSPDGAKLATLEIPYKGGDGVRIFPAEILERVAYRPCGEEHGRAIDGSIADRLARAGSRPRFLYHDLHDLQIVDFKSSGPGQRNTYDACLVYATRQYDDPFDRLAEFYPAPFLDEVSAAIPARRRMVAA